MESKQHKKTRLVLIENDLTYTAYKDTSNLNAKGPRRRFLSTGGTTLLGGILEA